MKKPDISKLTDKIKEQVGEIESIDDLKELPKKVDKKTYAGISLASGIGIAATTFVPVLRPLTTVFQAAAVASAGMAAHKISEEKREAAENYRKMRAEVAKELLQGGIPAKAAKDLTEEDAVRMAMLSDIQLGRLPKAHQAEALKVQIALDVHDAHRKNQSFAPQLSHLGKNSRFLHSDKGLDLLLEEREMVRTLMNAPPAEQGGVMKAAHRFSNMRMTNRILNSTKSGQKIARKVGKGRQMLNKVFMLSQTMDTLKDSARIFNDTPLPIFKDTATFVDFNVARLHQAQDTLKHIKEGTATPVGFEGMFRKPR